ncbi:insulin-like growth factor 2 mRNA-binding protein 3 [Platysternon megacephalum]|uniref:Insulin-like growth factor 2 mRNA-binding protein 3 n=1 Tax=Platysternon megacephalum TaxID=55544 RepID=A0A4D9EC00_9SAUR|nr:insulin-like growth factor 2 mRNA-binding protein 3 [Platysternon megacephalum]
MHVAWVLSSVLTVACFYLRVINMCGLSQGKNTTHTKHINSRETPPHPQLTSGKIYLTVKLKCLIFVNPITTAKLSTTMQGQPERDLSQYVTRVYMEPQWQKRIGDRIQLAVQNQTTLLVFKTHSPDTCSVADLERAGGLASVSQVTATPLLVILEETKDGMGHGEQAPHFPEGSSS